MAPTIGARDLSAIDGGESEVVQEKIVRGKGREAEDEWDSVEAAVLLPDPFAHALIRKRKHMKTFWQ